MRLLWQGAWPLFRMIAGLTLWLSCFGMLYAGLSLACTYGVPDGRFAGLPAINWALVGLWLLHLLPLAWLTVYSWRACRGVAAGATPAARFVLHASWLGNAAALVATLWIGAPVLVTVPCI